MTEIAQFDHELFIQNLNSPNPFPWDFDLVWELLGYSRKDNAKRVLESNLEEGFDFSASKRKTSKEGGRPADVIMLSHDAFKHMAMMAGTDTGKQVRKYFIQCEQELMIRRANDQLEQTKRIADHIEVGEGHEYAWRQEHKEAYLFVHRHLEQADTQARELSLIAQAFLTQAVLEADTYDSSQHKKKTTAERFQLLNSHIFKLQTNINWAFTKLDSYKGNYL